VGRVVIATAEFAPMPRLHLPGYPGRFDSDGHRMRFRRHDGIYQSDVGSLKTKPEPNIASRQCSDSSPRTRREDQRSRPIVSMSSGRLFLDRVGRHQSPSPLHRRDQIKLVARSEGTIYHRTVTSALTGCLTFRDKPKQSATILASSGSLQQFVNKVQLIATLAAPKDGSQTAKTP
jgi:hypothetical protein